MVDADVDRPVLSEEQVRIHQLTLKCCVLGAGIAQPAPIKLCSNAQTRILEDVRAGRNVFLTGSAGTGVCSTC